MSTQYRVVSGGTVNAEQYLGEIELYNEDGTEWTGSAGEAPVPLAEMTAADAEAGTSTEAMSISPAVLNAEIARQIGLIPPPA